MLIIGISVEDPTLLWAVVIAARVAAAAPGPAAVTSPVKLEIADVVMAGIAAVVSPVTRPLASMLSTGTTLADPTLLWAVVIAASVGTG
jgi:hypothetical protein